MIRWRRWPSPRWRRERVELTPSVVVAFPRSPTTLAQQAWDIHANSGGRFVLGLGSQVKGHNERRFGIAWTAPAPRMRDYVHGAAGGVEGVGNPRDG